MEGGAWLKESWGAKKCDGRLVVWNGVGAQGEGHDGMRGEVRDEGAWLRNTEDGETRMGNGWCGMGSVRRVKGMMGCGVKYGVKGLG